MRVKRRIREVQMDFPRNPCAKLPHGGRHGLLVLEAGLVMTSTAEVGTSLQQSLFVEDRRFDSSEFEPIRVLHLSRPKNPIFVLYVRISSECQLQYGLFAPNDDSYFMFRMRVMSGSWMDVAYCLKYSGGILD